MRAVGAVAVGVFVALAQAPAAAAGGNYPRARTHQEASAQVPRHGQPRPQGVQPQATNPGMPSFHQPSYSIDRREWWQPHPYFPQNAQSPGYPSHPGRPPASYRR